ncbi:MAG: thymidine phosphorylase [Candidatus Zixiibacteriota bacterium]|nr:MAG: thymidine phosphorylase [candidate division Zixibacteria bacterium]
MKAVEIIARKRDGISLSKSEIDFFLNSYIKGSIKDYQMSSLLMAVYLNGMSDDETVWLTEAMVDSGDKIVFPIPDDIYVDKHSTGGVGDKVSLILAPLVASCGARVPMLSGRGLGHTGGTLDKLESIPGFRTDLTLDEFRIGVEKIGCVITGQTENIAPADRLMYALRDVTATVESIPLICGSILSKKFAAGPRGLVFDVKCGNGAFMKDIESAGNLSRNLIRISKLMGRNVRALITDMNQPLGSAAGNLLEVLECIEFLRGFWQDDLYNVTMELGAEMLTLAGIESGRQQAIRLLKSKLEDGSALRKFQEMVEYQNGDFSGLFDRGKTPRARYIVDHKANQDGYLQRYSTYEVGRLVIELGGGRMTKEDLIDPAVGFKFYKKIGDEVSVGEIIAEIYARDKGLANDIDKKLYRYIEIGEDRPNIPEFIKERLG